MARTNNPVLSRIEKENEFNACDVCTYNGVALRTGILLVIAFLSAIFCMVGLQRFPEVVIPLLVVSSFLTFLFVLCGSLSIKLAKPMSILTSICEGLSLGLLSLCAEIYVSGAVGLAIFVTFTVCAVTLMLYSSRVIKVSNKFRKIMSISLISLAIVSVFVLIIDLIFPALLQIPYPIMILISVCLILYGALLLVSDFDRVETLINMGADKRCEWQLALGILLDIVWIYVEVIRLIILIANKND